jgi:hypothetical protein
MSSPIYIPPNQAPVTQAQLTTAIQTCVPQTQLTTTGQVGGVPEILSNANITAGGFTNSSGVFNFINSIASGVGQLIFNVSSAGVCSIQAIQQFVGFTALSINPGGGNVNVGGVLTASAGLSFTAASTVGVAMDSAHGNLSFRSGAGQSNSWQVSANSGNTVLSVAGLSGVSTSSYTSTIPAHTAIAATAAGAVSSALSLYQVGGGAGSGVAIDFSGDSSTIQGARIASVNETAAVNSADLVFYSNTSTTATAFAERFRVKANGEVLTNISNNILDDGAGNMTLLSTSGKLTTGTGGIACNGPISTTSSSNSGTVEASGIQIFNQHMPTTAFYVINWSLSVSAIAGGNAFLTLQYTDGLTGTVNSFPLTGTSVSGITSSNGVSALSAPGSIVGNSFTIYASGLPNSAPTILVQLEGSYTSCSYFACCSVLRVE